MYILTTLSVNFLVVCERSAWQTFLMAATTASALAVTAASAMMLYKVLPMWRPSDNEEDEKVDKKEVFRETNRSQQIYSVKT